MTLIRDTTPTAAAVQLRIMRAMPAWRKLALAAQMQEQTDTIILQAIQQRYPHATPRELRRRLFDRKLGPARALAVYGPLDAWIEP